MNKTIIITEQQSLRLLSENDGVEYSLQIKARDRSEAEDHLWSIRETARLGDEICFTMKIESEEDINAFWGAIETLVEAQDAKKN
jgi:hypothetical protein